ncbi:hypothetical protein Taro_052966, partial [Colocasia esculenta]|nr:hypothetical protein [Colocasia esculenta]
LPLDVKLEGERAEPQQYWSSIKCPSNNDISFRKNVWKYYGVCSNMTESDYFGAALGVRAKVDLLSVLADKGIVPSVVAVYSVESIRRAVKEAVGVTPLVCCSQAPLFPRQFLLFEIYVCVDKDDKTLIECPVSPYFRCSDLILFPPFEYDMLKDTTTAAAVDPSSQLGDSNPIRMPVSTQY